MSSRQTYRGIRRIAYLFASVLLASATLWGQTTGTGTIDGTVTDTTGAVIPGVQITATHVATGATHTTVTNGSGFYVLTPLQIGEYKIRHASRLQCLRSQRSDPGC